MNESNREELTGEGEGTARWGEARPRVCGDMETKKGDFNMEGRPCKRRTRRCLLDVYTRIIVILIRETSGNRSSFWRWGIGGRGGGLGL